MDAVDDPLTRQLLASRKNETEEQRMRREYAEREAMKRSREIDEWIKAGRPKDRKRRKTAKVLLVGQSESGKSTTLKNFQLHYAPKAFQAERARWKTVILLNLVRSLRRIHEALNKYSASQPRSNNGYPTPHSTPATTPMEQTPSLDYPGAQPQAASDEDTEESDIGLSSHRKRPKLTPQHRLLLLRLRPALSLEPQLLRTLISESSSTPSSNPNSNDGQRASSHTDWYTNWRNEVPDDYTSPSPLSSTPVSFLSSPSSSSPSPFVLSDEVVVPAGWNQIRSTPPQTPRPELENIIEFVSGRASPDVAFQPNRLITRRERSGSHNVVRSLVSSPTPENEADSYIGRAIDNGGEHSTGMVQYPALPIGGSMRSIARSPTPSSVLAEVPERVLAACAGDILALWNDEVIRNLLCGPLYKGGLGLRLHEDAGFFLDDVERITAPSYMPTDDDILRARLKTMGVSEHKFVLEQSSEVDTDCVAELVVYDVGGARTQRHQWMNFFDDVNVIVFLAPISAFDQRLVEDPSVNRLQDTFNLWKEVTRAKQLSKVDFLIFLNKCDLLEAKMKSGLKLRKFIPQYSGGDNIADAVKFFRGVFTHIWQKNSAPFKQNGHLPRNLYVHSTSMIDFKTSRAVIQSVQNCALRSNLKEAMVI